MKPEAANLCILPLRPEDIGRLIQQMGAEDAAAFSGGNGPACGDAGASSGGNGLACEDAGASSGGNGLACGDAGGYRSRADMQSRGEGVSLIAWEGDTPLGQLFIRWTGNTEVPRIVDRYPQAAQFAGCPEICDVYVVPERRSQGIGAQLLRRAFALARERGITQVTIGVDKDNPRARALYERLGFVETGIGVFTTSGVLIDAAGREVPWQNGPQFLLVKNVP